MAEVNMWIGNLLSHICRITWLAFVKDAKICEPRMVWPGAGSWILCYTLFVLYSANQLIGRGSLDEIFFIPPHILWGFGNNCTNNYLYQIIIAASHWAFILPVVVWISHRVSHIILTVSLYTWYYYSGFIIEKKEAQCLSDYSRSHSRFYKWSFPEGGSVSKPVS